MTSYDIAGKSRATREVTASCIFVMFLLAAFAGLSSSAQAGTLTATDYEATTIEGWTVWIEKSLDTHPRKASALKLLSTKLAKIETVVPPAALPKLKKVPIWLSRDVAHGAAYHPSAGWLKANRRVIEMEHSIEIANIDDFIDWSVAQPEMLLHELAHAWHHQVLNKGYDNPVIKKTYDAAVASGTYESVHYYDGQMRRAYALNNQMEYFAECTEAYFGKNDFEPFNRDQLKTFDPEAYRMIRKMWGVATP
ncbi:MAG: hypothetical protein ABIS50_16765 [Luteolibacter sp.]|uniref:anthrax toxin lethal factor-related metalloendopeptidase n=1 Tax=Luteolibacter sp. TaxID=1962973 RepID=UPI00326642C3